ncbi:MAG: HAMP domain-containing protein [Desmonostoc vinosum HA7617-LM4]|jgi:signal transduction histidine kinase|nr:HAMP domain-containing protein [Desmonostoc vinosum HA7617-LM4]
MKNFPFPLKFSIPVILLAAGGVLSLISFQTEIYLSDRRIEKNAINELAFSGSQTAGLIEYLYREQAGNGIDVIVDHIGTAPNIKLVVVANDKGQVIAATRFGLLGKTITQTPFTENQQTIKDVQKTLKGRNLIASDRTHIIAIYPVGLKFLSGQSLPNQVAVLLIDYDLTAAKTEGIQDAQSRSLIYIIGLAILCLLLWLFFNHIVTQRVTQLVVASDEFAQGKLQARANLQGSDELAQVAYAFNEMATKIQYSIETIHRTQAQLIQSEKMSSLGQMVAGIAHEINNPNNFIHANLPHVEEYTQRMLDLLEFYQIELPQPSEQLQDYLQDLDLEFVQEDLPRILASMRSGTQRIRAIVLSLRNFSRLDESDLKTVNLHEGLDSTLLILESRFKATAERPEITLIKEYDENLPTVECYAGELNQVFLNIISNAIDVLHHSNSKILIQTKTINHQLVEIDIIDNGVGMNEDVCSRIFDPFFTTKPVGKGTGLGLSISYQIVVDRHNGKIWCDSTPGQGTKFAIKIPTRQILSAENSNDKRQVLASK